jgi:hypothetical protein
VIFLKKRNQVNITLEESAVQNVTEYCRVHGVTPQELFKAGAQRLIDEDILERAADVMTLRSLREMSDGLAEPIDDLLDMIEEDKRLGDEKATSRPFLARKTA